MSQSFTDYELILTNDGSPDRSGAICEEYAAKDARIRYYAKENEGLLLTRRHAIKRARGEYVLFLDSDDYWSPDLLETVDRELKQDPVDLLMFRQDQVSDSGKTISAGTGLMPDHTRFDVNNKSAFWKLFLSTSRLNVMFTKCVRRQVIDAETDYSGFGDVIGEDRVQSINIIDRAESILYIDKPLYHYRQSISSYTRVFKMKYFDDFEKVRDYVNDRVHQIGLSQELIDLSIQQNIRGLLIYIRQFILTCSAYPQCVDVLERLIKRSLFVQSAKRVKPGDMTAKQDRFDYRQLCGRHYRLLWYRVRLHDRLRRLLKHQQ